MKTQSYVDQELLVKLLGLKHTPHLDPIQYQSVKYANHISW